MLNVLWCTNNGLSDWEYDYIKELLDKTGLEYNVRPVTMMNDIVPNALIIINHSVQYVQYLMQYEQQGVPFGVIHLSDEWFDDYTVFYNFKMCKFAFRNYYDKLFEDRYPTLQYLPLSYKHGFWSGYNGKSPRDITFDDRKYVWSFAGAPRTDARRATLELFKSQQPCHVHFETGNSFSSPESGLQTNMYRDLLLDSQFGLCAIGISKTRSGDTGRVTEVLETGGIPIVLAGRNTNGTTYWKSLYGEEPPYVMCNTWEECLEAVKQLRADPVAAENVRVACFDFWCRQKDKIGKKVKDLVMAHLT